MNWGTHEMLEEFHRKDSESKKKWCIENGRQCSQCDKVWCEHNPNTYAQMIEKEK